MHEAVIVSTARTPIGKAYRGAFNDTEAPVLGGHVMKAAVERAGIDPATIDDVFWGVGNQWGTQGGNAARMAIFEAGLPIDLVVSDVVMPEMGGFGLPLRPPLPSSPTVWSAIMGLQLIFGIFRSEP